MGLTEAEPPTWEHAWDRHSPPTHSNRCIAWYSCGTLNSRSRVCLLLWCLPLDTFPLTGWACLASTEEDVPSAAATWQIKILIRFNYFPLPVPSSNSSSVPYFLPLKIKVSFLTYLYTDMVKLDSSDKNNLHANKGCLSTLLYEEKVIH